MTRMQSAAGGRQRVAALGSYFEQVGAQTEYGTHPPGWFRIRLMLDWLGDVEDAALQRVLQPWRELADTDHEVEDDWAQYLVEIFMAIAADIPPLLVSIPPLHGGISYEE